MALSNSVRIQLHTDNGGFRGKNTEWIRTFGFYKINYGFRDRNEPGRCNLWPVSPTMYVSLNVICPFSPNRNVLGADLLISARDV